MLAASLSATILSGLGTSAVLAQDARSAEASKPGIEEIVVTARKREENLQDVPISISALTSEELRAKGVSKPEDLQMSTPGLEIRTQSSQRNNLTYFIRGQGQTVGSPASVVTYFAEAPMNNSTKLTVGNNYQLFDIASVQVLKGPQGTLFGRSSTGGAVLVAPQRPTDEFGGFLEQSFGDYSWRETNGALNVPLVDGVLNARIAANIVRRDGFTKSLTTGQELDDRHRDSYRLGLEFTPTESINSYLMYGRSEVDENNTGAVLLDFNENNAIYNTTPGVGAGWGAVQGLCGAINPGNATGAQACATQRLGILNDLRNGLIAEEARVKSGGDDAKRRNVTASNLVLAGKIEQLLNITTFNIGEAGFLGDVTVKNVFNTNHNLGVHAITDGGSPLPNGLFYNNHSIEGFQPVATRDASARNDWLDDYSEEFQIMGDIGGRHSWIIGYYQEVQKYDYIYPPLFSPFGNVLSPTLTPTVVGGYTVDQKDEQKGYFAQTTFDLSEWVADGLKLTTGYRWTESTSTRGSLNATLLGGNLVPTGALTQRPPVDDSAPSWTVSVDYQLDDSTLVYLAHRRGFKPGGVNTTPDLTNPPIGFVATYDPETVDDIELGIKADWALAGMPVRSNAAIYRMWYDDIQRNQSVVSLSGTPGTQVNNIAKAGIQGLELSTQLIVTDGLQLSFTYSYIDAEYKKWPGFVTNIFTREQLPNIDNPFVGTPEHQGTIGVSYSLPTPDAWGEIRLMADYYRQTAVWLNDTALADSFGKEDGYGNLNLRADWANVFDSPFDVAVFVRNATDDLHAVALLSSYSSVGTAAAIYNEPRMWGASLRYRFGGK
jgi:iron complex outermembrane recepter protein